MLIPVNNNSIPKPKKLLKQINYPEKQMNSPKKQCKTTLPVLGMRSKQANTSDVGKCSKLFPVLPEWTIRGQLRCREPMKRKYSFLKYILHII